MIRVFLVDDHEIVRRGVQDVLDAESDLEVVGEAGTVAEAVVAISEVRPDVAVLDVRLPDGNGVELCRELRSRLPELHCLMLTSYTDDEALLDAIIAGAAGFVLKQVLGADLAGGVRAVGSGRSLLEPRAEAAARTRLLATGRDPVTHLSPQERTVFELIGEGLTNRQISERMSLSEKTVKNYVSRVLTTLDLQRRAQVAATAAQRRHVPRDA